jgi:hypothetical protein
MAARAKIAADELRQLIPEAIGRLNSPPDGRLSRSSPGIEH